MNLSRVPGYGSYRPRYILAVMEVLFRSRR
jgi:hypothetical protein